LTKKVLNINSALWFRTVKFTQAWRSIS